MKAVISELMTSAVKQLQANGILPNIDVVINIERTRNADHGDFACNVALALAKAAKQKPRDLAEKIIAEIPKNQAIANIEIAGPGFINFYLAQAVTQAVIIDILKAGTCYGTNTSGNHRKVHMEYVSANPTGPLHVGHGRGAAYGACVANLLKANGYDVHREYYVNDAGRQMRILALSVWLRYLAQMEQAIVIPEGAYLGEYIIDIAKDLAKQYKEKFNYDYQQFMMAVNQALEHCQTQTNDNFLDCAVNELEQAIGADNFNIVRNFSTDAILNDIREDLSEFGVTYDNWFRESQLFDEKLLQAGVELLDKHGYTYEKDGAIWFKATELGDDKDRVLIRANGVSTYFASDVAYHLYKYQHKYDHIIDVFGADHHGYIPRIRAFLEGLHQDPDRLTILLVQFAILYRGKEKVSMSTRKGQFVTLRELRNEVGNDAARFFYIMRRPEQHLDFDLELAKSQSNDNPLYYIQYAHARICSVWRQLETDFSAWNHEAGLEHVSLLTNDHEKQLLDSLQRYPELVQTAGQRHEPHIIAHYLFELAGQFHTYYNSEKFLVADENLRSARLVLIAAIKQVIANGLKLLGITAVDEM